jgi:nucleoside-diphosphate-sugar epimerase
MNLAVEQSNWQQRSIKFLYPSSIAVYGIKDLKTKATANRVKEDQFNWPITMYGCNKLYCEHLGRYYAAHYRQLAVERDCCPIDFRCLRFPGLISAITVPSGGTSDYGPEMLHHAAKGEAYACFVQPTAQLPFMAMPDAVKALIDLEAASLESLTRMRSHKPRSRLNRTTSVRLLSIVGQRIWMTMLPALIGAGARNTVSSGLFKSILSRRSGNATDN